MRYVDRLIDWLKRGGLMWLVAGVAILSILWLVFIAGARLGNLHDTTVRQNAIMDRQERIIEVQEVEIERRETEQDISTSRVRAAIQQIQHIEELLTEQTEEMDKILEQIQEENN